MGMTDKAFTLQNEAEGRADKAFELNQAAARQGAQILSSQETHAADRLSREKISRAQIAAQTAAQNRPGETERMLSRIDAIRSGKEMFAGKSGEEGVKAFTNAMGDIGAARYGARYTGPDKTEDRFLTALKNNSEYQLLQTQRAQLGTKPELNAKQQLRLDMIDKRIKTIETDTRAKIGTSPSVGDAVKAPKPGTVMEGYRFRGGDPADQTNWEKVD